MPAQLAFAVVLPNGSTTAAFTLAAPVNVSFHMWVPHVMPQVLHMNLSLLALTPITLVSSQVGTVRVNLLSSTLGFLISHVVVPAANRILAPGFPIPSSAEGFTLNRTDLTIEGGAVQVKADFALNTTARLRAIRDEPPRLVAL